MAQREIDLTAFETSEMPSPTQLPPAGFERDEELKRREDNLQERAETLAAERDVGVIPQKVLEPDREIQYAIKRDFLSIGVNHPFLKTKWVNYVNQHGSKVWEAKTDGWMVANADHFKGTEDYEMVRDLIREDNSIRVGDVMLMCIRMDRHLMLEKREAEKRRRQQFGVEAEIHDMANSVNRKRGQRVFAGVSTPEVGVSGELSPRAHARLDSLTRQSEARDVSLARQIAAKRVASQHVGEMLKSGTVPGLPIK